ncbi:hypothetical protein EJ110_NYTH11546 [Nymphaea thermarum]|nr:hypothetical protein EJ110_NYTH11546 [Nymphaea thermarum]
MCSSTEGTKCTKEASRPSHPLQQIAESPTHRLLLKQWIKEEELISQRVSSKEWQIDAARKEITQLYCFFFIFHSSFLVLLYTSVDKIALPSSSSSCHRSWIPTLLSLVCSLAMIWAIRYKMDVESHTERLLNREKEDGKLLLQCVQELKKKGVEFDLLKEVDALRRAKSLRVETKPVKRWSSRDFVTLFFVVVACSVLGVVRVILCS